MEYVRTFVAVELGRQWHVALGRLQERLQRELGLGKDLRWVRPEGIHLTLKFLGPVVETDLPQVCSAVNEAVAGFAPFAMEAELLGAFPPGRPARVLWLGTAEPPVDLIDLQGKLEERLAMVGFEPEKRAYHPHFTLARVHGLRSGTAVAQFVAAAKPVQGMPVLDVHGLTVFRSDLERSGAQYTVLHRVAIGNQG